MSFNAGGELQILSTSWNSSAVQDVNYTNCRLPYSGTNGNGTHGTVIFFNSAGYGRMVGRCYITLYISQIHSGYFDFYVSKYGGGIQNAHNTNWTHVVYQSNINSNGDWHGFVWYNTNSNTWGNGTLSYRVESWGGSLVSGQYNYSHSSGYYNWQGDGSQPTNMPFARRLN